MLESRAPEQHRLERPLSGERPLAARQPLSRTPGRDLCNHVDALCLERGSYAGSPHSHYAKRLKCQAPRVSILFTAELYITALAELGQWEACGHLPPW
jgi:hypothetical protein